MRRVEPRNRARRPKMIANTMFRIDRQRTPPVNDRENFTKNSRTRAANNPSKENKIKSSAEIM